MTEKGNDDKRRIESCCLVISQNHAAKRTGAELVSPPHHQTSAPDNFHLVSSADLQHGFFFDDKPPHEDVISQ